MSMLYSNKDQCKEGLLNAWHEKLNELLLLTLTTLKTVKSINDDFHFLGSSDVKTKQTKTKKQTKMGTYLDLTLLDFTCFTTVQHILPDTDSMLFLGR